MKKNIFILLPDGVGLKNFAFTKFNHIASENNLEITYWNNTIFDLSKFAYKEVKIQLPKLNPQTVLYKTVRTHLEINKNVKNFKDDVYKSYLFPFNTNGIKNKLRTALTKFLIKTNKSPKGLNKIINKTYSLETNTPYYNQCITQLKEHKPSLVLCTNQRTSLAIAPIEAAKSLGIKTACFIFSWDNLPKAMLLIDTDFYLVWSDFMKAELLKYYPHIKNEQVIVTGTPQFENHFNLSELSTYNEFCAEHNLDHSKKYFMFSGDDITTSPNDPMYLEDTAKAVVKLNQSGHNFGIIFRRCPVDFSNRFDEVLKKYSNIIFPIPPAWQQMGGAWHNIMPTIEDMKLQANCIHHTQGVLNLGSSMVFDAIAHNKTCAYFNYNNPNSDLKKWNVKKIYSFVHFRSMPSKQAVHWVNAATDIENILVNMLKEKTPQHTEAKKWFDIICKPEQSKSSQRIVEAIKSMI